MQHQRLKKYVLGCHLGWVDRRFGHLFMKTWPPRTYFCNRWCFVNRPARNAQFTPSRPLRESWQFCCLCVGSV